MIRKVTGIKVPCEMALFALKEKAISQVGIYLASHFHYSGKAKNLSEIIKELEEYLPIKDRQIRRGLNWLIEREWIQKASNNWYFFKSIDHVHRIEHWEFARATRMYSKDLKQLKAYLAASFFTSLIETGIWGNRTVRINRRTETPRYPISLSSIEQILDCSKDTARKLRNNAHKYKYINNEPNLVRIKSIKPETLKHLKIEGIQKIKANLFGYPDAEIIAIDRVRYKEGWLYIQKPNLIQSRLEIKSRRGLNRSTLSG